MKLVQIVIAIVALLLILACLAGCSAEYWTGRLEPTTRIDVSAFGAGFKDTKNNDLRIENLKVDPVTKQFNASLIILKNNSSEVVNADTERMKYIIEAQRVQVEYQRQIGQNIAMALAAGGEAAKKFITSLPNLSMGLDTQLGSGTFDVIRPTSQPSG